RSDDGLSDFCDSLSTFTHYSRFKLVNTLRYGDIFNIVSSIEFDRDDEYFATAGVTKKIKIFDYGNIERLIVNTTLVILPYEMVRLEDESRQI
ncbi:10559_t:CDS:1, partial [Paraglomus occultum]